MSDISQIKLPDNTTYNINAKTVNGHTVDKDVPSSAVFTDQYVAQVSSLTEDNNYRVLLSGSASDNTQTESVRKSSVIKINPKYDAITMGYDRASGSAYGVCSLTQGSNIIASGQYSHGEGWWTIANHRSQHVFGEYNIADVNAASATARGDYVEIVGNGTGDSTRSNARTLDWDGTETLAGSLLLAGTTSDIHLTGTDNYWYGTTTSLKTAVSSLEHDLSDLTPLEKTASGAIASFDDGSALPMPKLEVAIEPQQEGSGDPSPTNIRPISGWDECNVTRCGKNLWGGEKLADDIVAKVPNATKNTTNHTVGYTSSNIADIILFKNFKEDTQYSIFIDLVSGTSTNLRVVYKDGTRQGITGNIYPFITQANKSVDYIIGFWATGSTTINYLTSGVFEGVITAQDFEPYNGQTYNIQFKDGDNPLTVYGGTLNVVSGKLVVDRAYVDLGTLAWGLRDSGTVVAPYFFSNIENLGVKYEGNFQTVVYSILCSMYKIVKRDVSAFVDGTICVDGAMSDRMVTQLQIKDARYSDAATFKTAMNGVQLVYELATPQTYQLTPTQVNSLLGVNNIWADTGDVDVIYFRNAKSTQAIKDIIDTTTAKDITFTKYKGLPTNVQEAINQTYDNVIALNGNMADYYFERQSYNVDDYVRYEDPYYGGYNLYRCIERSDGGSFDYNKWFRTNIGDEFSEIRQSLSNLLTIKSITVSHGTINAGKASTITDARLKNENIIICSISVGGSYNSDCIPWSYYGSANGFVSRLKNTGSNQATNIVVTYRYIELP